MWEYGVYTIVEGHNDANERFVFRSAGNTDRYRSFLDGMNKLGRERWEPTVHLEGINFGLVMKRAI